MAKIAVLKKQGPYILGRQSGMYVVQDIRSGAVSVFPSDKAAALRSFGNKVANLRHEVAEATDAAQRDADCDALYRQHNP